MTPRQRWLLAAVKAGEVRQALDFHTYHHQTGQKLDGALRHLPPGLVEVGDRIPTGYRWRLTERGERAMSDDDTAWREVTTNVTPSRRHG